MSNEFELTITRVIPASAEAVFDAWLDPQALASFMKPMDGMPDCDVELDPVVGGRFAITMKAGDAQIPIHGEYRTIERPTKLVFSWLSEHTSENSTVSVTLIARGPEETELRLHHVGFRSEQACGNHQGGWRKIAEQLAHSVS